MTKKKLENDQERRPIVITSNLKILVIVIVTISLTFLFVRSNQTMVNTPMLVKTIYNTVDAGLMTNNVKNRLVFPASNVSMVTNSTKETGTDHILPQKQGGILRNEQEVSLSVTKEQPLNTNLQDTKEFRTEKTGLIQDDYFVDKPTLYRNKLNGYMTNNTIDTNLEDNQSEVTAKNGMYQMNPEANSINHEYSTIDVNIPLSEANGLNSHYNVNDSSYSSGSYKYKEIEIPVDEIKLVTDGQSEKFNTIENVSPSGSGSNAYRPHSNHDFKARYSTGQALYNRPSATIPIKKRQQSNYVPDEEYYKPISQQLPSNISLKNDSALLLIILKLKMIGVLQTIFLLGFKLKLYFIAIFTTFLLLTKLMKFFQIIMLPILLLSSFPVFASMLNGTNNTLASFSTQSSLLSMLLPSSLKNMGESSSSGSSSFSSSSGSPASSSSFSTSSFTIPDDIPPNILQLLLPGLSGESSGRMYMDISCDSSGILLPDLSPDGTIRSKIEPPYYTSKVKKSNVFRRQQYNSVKSLYPTLTISRKILDSEKCVEKIACRLAVAEKAGIIPLWVKLRILNGVSKLIPEEKYELYFKTYNFVTNEIETTKTLLTPDNWAEWCLERYNSDNTTN